MGRKYDITYSTEVESRHPKWVKPYRGGALKAFFLPSVQFGREYIELAQRMDVSFDAVTVEKTWDLNKWGLGEYYHIRGGIGDFRIAYQNFEDAMTSDEWFDVLVIPGVNGWGLFGSRTLAAIRNRVESGAGLVIVKPFHGENAEAPELDALSPLSCLFEEGFGPSKMGGEEFPKPAYDLLKSEIWQPKPHYITDGVPFKLFPYDELSFYPYKADGEVVIQSESGCPIAAVKEYGKGRVAAFGWYPRDILPQHAAYRPEENFYNSVIADMPGAMHSLSFQYLEYFYSLLYRSMIWAARREPENKIEDIKYSASMLSIEISLPSLDKGGCPQRGRGDFTLRLMDDWDNEAWQTEAHSPTIPLPEWTALGGRYRADVFLGDSGGVCDWHTAVLNYPLKSRVLNIGTSAREAGTGDAIEVEVRTEGTEGELRMEIVDGFGRIQKRDVRKLAGNGLHRFQWVVGGILSIDAHARAEIRVSGHLIDRKDSAPVVIRPDSRAIDDFEVFMNSHSRGQGDRWDLHRKLALDLGVTGSFPGSQKVMATSGAEGLGIYWYYRFPYVERKDAYLNTLDKKYLHRVPCLNDEVFWQEMEHKMIPEVARNRKFAPVSYFANDEGSLTCYSNELDLCFCDHCIGGLRLWLREVYGSLDALNASWRTAYAAWDEAMPFTYEEASKAQNFVSWADHRLFMEKTFTHAYERIAGVVRSQDPEGVIRMSGCQLSTPYTGYDYWQLHRHIGYFEAYESGNQFELHRSFARERTIIGAWLGYGARGVAVKNRIWNAMLHGVSIVSVFAEHNMINPDCTFFSGALDMRDAFIDIRRSGIGKLLLHAARRDNMGIGVHYSMASIHGAYALGCFPRQGKARQAWLELLEAAGWQYDFVATQQIEQGDLIKKGLRVFILPVSVAITLEERKALEAFVEAGGMLIADMGAGIMDGHCKLSDAGCLDALFGIRRVNHRTRPFSMDDCVTAVKGCAYPELIKEKLLDQEVEYPIAESGLRLDGGDAAFIDDFMRKMPAVVVNRRGKGFAVYLNAMFDEYLNPQADSAFMKRTLGRLFAMAGLVKPVSLKRGNEEADDGYETFRFTDGPAATVALLRNQSGNAKVLYDGRMASGEGGAAEQADTVRLELPEKAHLYDARNKKYLGFGNAIDMALLPGECGVYSALPHAVASIGIASPGSVKRGGSIRFDVSVATDKPDGAYANVLSLNFHNPDGGYEWIYSENVSVTGKNCSKTCLIPFNEAAGTWELIVTDAATGVSAVRTFVVE